MKRTEVERQRSDTALRYPSGGIRIPASHWMGSMSTAQVFGVTAEAIASISPNGTEMNPGVNGPKPSLYAFSEENPTIVVVRPWKLLLQTMISALSAGIFFIR